MLKGGSGKSWQVSNWPRGMMLGHLFCLRSSLLFHLECWNFEVLTAISTYTLCCCLKHTAVKWSQSIHSVSSHQVIEKSSDVICRHVEDIQKKGFIGAPDDLMQSVFLIWLLKVTCKRREKVNIVCQKGCLIFVIGFCFFSYDTKQKKATLEIIPELYWYCINSAHFCQSNSNCWNDKPQYWFNTTVLNQFLNGLWEGHI